MNEQIRKWAEIAGIPLNQVSSENDLFGLFQRFRPSGIGVDAIFERMVRGDEILSRLRQCYAATAPGYQPGDVYFIPRGASCDRELGLKLLRRHLDSMREIAMVMKDDEIVSLLNQVVLKVVSSEEEMPAILPSGDNLEVWIYDLVTDYGRTLKPIESSVILLKEAFYSIANDEFLKNYLLWPLYKESSTLQEPFLPYFEMWTKGISFTLVTTQPGYTG